uniref:Uncharacterized protein n=1 Tax=Anopheles atroparvus TaxID=41427 RepID=A0A182J484_ANOAO
MMISFLFIFCVTITIAVTLHVVKKYRDVRSLLKKLPNFRAVPSLPLVGSAHLFQDSTPDGMLRTLTKFHQQYGKNLILQELGNEFKLLTIDPRVIEQVIQTRNIMKTKIYRFLSPWVGNSLVTLEGHRWSTRRKIIDPAFHFKMLDDFIPTMVAQTDMLVEKIRNNVGGSDFDVYFPLRHCTMDIIGEAAMGIQLHCQTNPDVEVIEATEELMDLVYKRIFNPLMISDFIYFFTDDGQRQRKALNFLHEYTHKVIRERKRLLFDSAVCMRSEEDQPVKMTFLDLLLESHCDGVPLPDDAIRSEVNTFMFAGHETTTSCVSFALFYISRIPDIQQRLYDEIVSVYGTKGDVRSAKITHASLQQLKYMEMVIKESLRICPPVPLIGRTSPGDMTVDGVAIPAGTEIIINIYIMQNDPEQYPDPDRFIPERFAEGCNRIPFS